MKILNVLKILLLVCSIQICLSAAFSAGIANVVLSSQDPDPIRPGNFVDLSFKISNSGDETISNARLELIENRYITLASTEEKIQYLGSIPAFSSVDDGFTVAKIRVFVDENTPIGDQEIQVKMIGSSQEFIRNFEITIREESPSLELDIAQSIEELTFKPGEQKELKLTLNNINSISVKDVTLTIHTSNEDSQLQALPGFYVIGSTNVKKVDVIRAQQSTDVTFNIGISPSASIQPYSIPLTLSYEDSLGNSYTEDVEITVLVNSEVDLLVTLDRVENNRMTFGIANPGPGVVKGAFVKVLDDSKEEISSEYIGDLNADDFQTIQVDSANINSSTVTIEIDFSDGYYNKDSTSKEFDISSNVTENSSSSSMFSFVVIILVIAAVGYYILRRRKQHN